MFSGLTFYRVEVTRTGYDKYHGITWIAVHSAGKLLGQIELEVHSIYSKTKLQSRGIFTEMLAYLLNYSDERILS